VTREQFLAVLSKETEPYKRMRAFAALLAEESGLGSDRLTVVGGSALEIYTTGEYVSADIDLVAEDPRKVESVLLEWGFQKKGMYWELAEFGTSVQIVGRFDSGSSERNQIVQTPYGKVRLASLEDILWKRIYESRGWKRPAALEEAALLVRRYWDRIDWDYLIRMAKENGVADLAEELRANRGKIGTGSSPRDERRNSE
jgi:hypothetical protein